MVHPKLLFQVRLLIVSLDNFMKVRLFARRINQHTLSWTSAFRLKYALLYPGIYPEGYIVFTFPFVCSFTCLSRLWNLWQSFSQSCVKVSQVGISHEPLIRKHSYLDHRYPGGSAFIPWLLTQGPCPSVGLEVKTRDSFKMCFSTFLFWKQLMHVVGKTWLSLVTLTCGSWSEGQHDLYFTVQWFCLISWRLFHVRTSYFGFKNQYDLRFDLKINVGHCDLYAMIQWFCLVSWRLFDIWTSSFGIMNQYDPTLTSK